MTTTKQIWEVSTNQDSNETVIRDSAGLIVANLECDNYGFTEDEQIKENAALIAAAPELLQVAKQAIEYLKDAGINKPHFLAHAAEIIKRAQP